MLWFAHPGPIAAAQWKSLYDAILMLLAIDLPPNLCFTLTLPLQRSSRHVGFVSQLRSNRYGSIGERPDRLRGISFGRKRIREQTGPRSRFLRRTMTVGSIRRQVGHAGQIKEVS
jgi:hypothetical protein